VISKVLKLGKAPPKRKINRRKIKPPAHKDENAMANPMATSGMIRKYTKTKREG